MTRPARVLVENGRELPHRHPVLDDLEPVLAVLCCEHGVGGGVTVPLADLVEGDRAFFLADGKFEIDVARTLLAQLHAVRGERLDVDTRPAALVENAGDVVDVGIVGADVDVKTLAPGKARASITSSKFWA